MYGLFTSSLGSRNIHLTKVLVSLIVLSYDHQNHSKWHEWCHVHYRLNATVAGHLQERGSPCGATSGVDAAASPRAARSSEHTDLAIERHGGRPPTGALPSGNASAQRRRQRAWCFVLTMAMAGASKVLLAFTAGRSPLPGRACRLSARRRVDSPPHTVATVHPLGS